ncbi:MAG TPA: Gfo/Idh/MocA family oxidoreductase, partial [Anaerolineae bacterium]
MTQYNVAIIGTGAAVNSHIEALHAAGERVQLVAAVDIDESCVRSACAQHNIPRWYTNAAAMLAEERP